MRDRFPRKVLVWPVAVQGSNCALEVAGAIEGFNALPILGKVPRPDLIIVARGGGSIEDLWGFNEEVVARSTFSSTIPIISAVGHETDTTLIDFVSDMRAPTPTAAAELAVPVRLDLLAELNSLNTRSARALTNTMLVKRQRLVDLVRALPRPETLILNSQQRLDILESRLPSALRSFVQDQHLRLIGTTGQIRPSLVARLIETESRQLQMIGNRLRPALERQSVSAYQILNLTVSGLRTASLIERTHRLRIELDDQIDRLEKNFTRRILELRNLLAVADRLRETLGYRETLKRGFSVIRSGASLITSVRDAKLEKLLEIEFTDGRLEVHLENNVTNSKQKQSKPPEQGQLL